MVPLEDFLLRSIDTRPFLGHVFYKHTMDCIVGTFNLQKCSLFGVSLAPYATHYISYDLFCPKKQSPVFISLGLFVSTLCSSA